VPTSSLSPFVRRCTVGTVALVAIAAGTLGCTRGDDPQVAITGKDNIGSATTGTTARRATGTTTKGTVPTRPNEVVMQDYAFVPDTLTVAAGTTVTWTNTESAPPVDHWVKSSPGQPGDLDSGRLPPGQSYNKTFAQPGTYEYFCDIHNFMKAKVVVQ
jgi:plastocyanin